MRSLSKGNMKEWPPLSPECKHKVWIVETSKTSTTNPMFKRDALVLIRERKKQGKFAGLIKAWSCVPLKKLVYLCLLSPCKYER